LFQATNIGKEADTSFQPKDKPRPAQGQGCDALVCCIEYISFWSFSKEMRSKYKF
jgi:hypothetical protein